MNKRILRKILLLVTVLMVVFAMASCKKKEEGIKTTVSIDVSKIFDHEADLNKDKADFVPEDGMILKKVTVVIGKDSNALDQLREACEDNDVQIEVSESQYGKFVDGLGQIYSGDCGEWSGWMFKVNGKWAELGADATVLNENDEVEWVFVCDYNTDM